MVLDGLLCDVTQLKNPEAANIGEEEKAGLVHERNRPSQRFASRQPLDLLN